MVKFMMSPEVLAFLKSLPAGTLIFILLLLGLGDLRFVTDSDLAELRYELKQSSVTRDEFTRLVTAIERLNELTARLDERFAREEGK